MPKSILEVKLGRPINMPSRRLNALLLDARRDCCRARNAAMMHWYAWRVIVRPDWQPGGAYDPPPLRIKRKPKPVDPDKPAPKDPPHAPREFLSREMYNAATAAAPKLNTSIVTSCRNEVTASLRDPTPYNHDGAARYKWQAILSNEISVPTWRGGRVPMPRSVSKLVYTDDICTVQFPLLSKAAGCKTLSPTVRLRTSDLSAGRRRILRRLASGDLHRADSQIVEKKGSWYVQFCYEVPVTASGLSEDRILTVLPALPEWPRPFRCTWTAADDPERALRWDIGNGKPLVADYRRVQARRRALRARYSDGCGSGHGKGRFYRTIKADSRRVIDMQSRFTKQAVSDIVSLAIREKCGSVLFREPSMPIRDCGWFAKQDVPFDWTKFETRLAHKCAVSGLAYSNERILMAEWRPKRDKEAG
jgi:hypothetical protein